MSACPRKGKKERKKDKGQRKAEKPGRPADVQSGEETENEAVPHRRRDKTTMWGKRQIVREYLHCGHSPAQWEVQSNIERRPLDDC